jgi:CrcB protein
MNYVWIALGGSIGAVLRYLVMTVFVSLRLFNFPYSTLCVNVVGSFLIGILAFYLVNKFADSESLRLFLIVGILGAFTTFSSFSLDTLHMLLAQRYLAAGTYILTSVISCLLATFAGMIVVQKFGG